MIKLKNKKALIYVIAMVVLLVIVAIGMFAMNRTGAISRLASTARQALEDETSGGSHTFTGLPKYDENGQEINYTVEEAEVTGGDLDFYSKSINGNSITNTFNVPDDTVTLAVTKVWEDNEIQAQRRPDEVKLKVKNGETVVQEYTLNTETETSHVFTNLPKYNENGEEISYTIEEAEVTTGDLKFYTKSEGSVTGGDEKTATVTNTFTRPTDKIQMIVNKAWVDNATQAQRRPEKINLQIKNGETVVQTYELDVATEISHTFTDLDKYNENGEEISYNIDEAEKTAGDLAFYAKSISGDTITNTYTTPEDKIELTVNKIWQDNETQELRRPGQVVLQVKDGDTVVQSYTLNTAALNGDPVLLKRISP